MIYKLKVILSYLGISTFVGTFSYVYLSFVPGVFNLWMVGAFCVPLIAGIFEIVFGKLLNTPYDGMVDNGVIARTFGKGIDTPVNINDESFEKTLNRYADTSTLDPQNHTGYVQKNSYYEEDYIVFADTYSVGSRESTFNTL